MRSTAGTSSLAVGAASRVRRATAGERRRWRRHPYHRRHAIPYDAAAGAALPDCAVWCAVCGWGDARHQDLRARGAARDAAARSRQRRRSRSLCAKRSSPPRTGASPMPIRWAGRRRGAWPPRYATTAASPAATSTATWRMDTSASTPRSFPGPSIDRLHHRMCPAVYRRRRSCTAHAFLNNLTSYTTMGRVQYKDAALRRGHAVAHCGGGDCRLRAADTSSG